MAHGSRHIAVPMHPSDRLRELILLGAVLFSATVVVFWPVLNHEFVNYDDPDYVTDNDWVKRGLTWEGAKWAFTTGHASNWHPLTWLSHMLDVRLFGVTPGAHHAVSVLFHAANSVLVLLWLWRMTGAVWRSAMVAALFALHPLHVESVAWVAERKDVLSAFFGLLCLMAYNAYAQAGANDRTPPSPPLSPVEPARGRRKSKTAYTLTFLFLALGLMSKPMLVTWPLLMLLLDFWPLKRLGPTTAGIQWPRLKLLIAEKIPFLLLVCTSCWVTLAVQQGAMSTIEGLPIGERLGNSFITCVAYLKQTFWPAGLAVFYPFTQPLTVSQWIVPAVIVLTISGLTLLSARRQPIAFVGWFWYLVSLIPVIGIVQVGAQARADRYTYLPLIGIFILLVWPAAQLLRLRDCPRFISRTLGFLVIVTMALTTRNQLRHWQDSGSLFAHAASVTQENFIAWAGLGIVEYRRGNYEQAGLNLTKALEYAPSRKPMDQIRFYLGATLQKQGRGRDALALLEQAKTLGELKPERDYRLGLSLLEAGRIEEAEYALQQACEARPDNPDFSLGLAALLTQQGRMADAGLLLTNIASHNPQMWLAHRSLANFLMQQGRPQEAEASYAKAVALAPKDPNLKQEYARCLVASGKLEPARHELEQALELSPHDPQTCFELAEVLSTQGRARQAVVYYEQAIQAATNHLPALNNLAWLLATHPDHSLRNGERAIELAERACHLTDWKQAILMGTLAAAYAEAGRFSDAAAMAERARSRARESGQEVVAQRNEDLIKLFQSGKPLREN